MSGTVYITLFDQSSPTKGYAYKGDVVYGNPGSTNANFSVVTGSLSLIGTIGAPSALQAAPTVTADTTNGGLNISYQPPTGNTDTWYASARVDVVRAGQ